MSRPNDIGCRLKARDLRLCLITDDANRPTAELVAVVEGALDGGVTAVQYREKSADTVTVAEQLRALSPICRARNAPLILNASLLHAARQADCLGLVDAVHYGRETWALRATLAPHLPAGYSAHEIEEAHMHLADGAAYVTLSPIFDTPSKRGLLPPRGIDWLREARQALGPDTIIVALGGITADNAAKVLAAGANGVAVIRAIMGDPPASPPSPRRNHMI
ncbi:MAG: thiamine phosphate synthase [Candidatus Sumerlaeaceae bacterium]|nr:thiamine phosphate synthase [Candidatus Sumerlaeaceae bacterium]